MPSNYLHESRYKMLKYNTPAHNFLTPSQEKNFEQCLTIGNFLIASSLFIMTICILVSFIFYHNFSLTSQVVAHVGTIVFAAIVKIGYVVRCIGAHGLGHNAY